MSGRDVLLVAGIALVAGILVGALGHSAWDTRRDARIEAAARARLSEVEAEREIARARAAEAERDREEAILKLRADSIRWEEERAELRRTADRARIRGDSIADEIVALFPETEALIAELRAENAAEVASEARRADVAEEEVRSLREKGIRDERLIVTLREEVESADARAEAAARSEVAARQASASRERWYKLGGGVTLLLILGAVAAS